MDAARRTLRPTRRMTAVEYLSGPPDEVKTELIYGEPVMPPRPSDDHQDLLHNLGDVLRRWSKHQGCGKVSFDVDMVLDLERDLVYAPDVSYLDKAHEGRM